MPTTHRPQPGKQTTELPSALSLLMPSWQAVRVNLLTLVQLAAIPLLVGVLGDTLSSRGLGWGGRLAFGIASDVLSLLFAPAMLIVQLKSVRGETIDFVAAVQQGLHFFWRYVGLSICLIVTIGVGLLLLIVPGLFMLRRYILSPYYLIDGNMKIFDAMRASAADSKRFSTAVWGLLLVEALFIVLIFVFVGIALSIMYYCAPALRYSEIKKAAKRKSAA